MKLKVPFVRSLKVWKGRGWCGPLALACVLRYYKFKDSVSEIVEMAGTHKNGGTVPHGLINVCLNKGMNVEYFSDKEIEENRNKKYSTELQDFLVSVDAEKLDKKFWKKNKSSGLFRFYRKGGTIDMIEKFLDDKKPVLIIHNVAVIYKEERMSPHYIVIVGYDKDNFYIHNVARGNDAFQKVNKKLLDESWCSGGLDKQLIVPYLK